MSKRTFAPRFIINDAGRKLAVVLNMKEYKALMEEVESARALKSEEERALVQAVQTKKTAKRELKAMRVKTKGLMFDRDEANE